MNPMDLVSKEPYRLYIDGQYVPSASGRMQDCVNPANNEVFAKAYYGDVEDARKAVAAARKAFDEGPWGRMAARDRAKILMKAAQIMERRADEAERETEKLKKVEYMEKRIGQIYEGVISGITSWGIYVELPNTVEGMIQLANLEDDYYIYDEERYLLVGERFHKTYRLGQQLQVLLIGADKLLKTIDFLPYNG